MKSKDDTRFVWTSILIDYCWFLFRGTGLKQKSNLRTSLSNVACIFISHSEYCFDFDSMIGVLLLLVISCDSFTIREVEICVVFEIMLYLAELLHHLRI